MTRISRRVVAAVAFAFAAGPLPMLAVTAYAAPATPVRQAAPTTPSPTTSPSPSATPTTSPTATPSPTVTQSPVPEVFVEVNPGTVEPGAIVGVRASCPDNSRSGTVESDAFGEEIVHPQGGLLTTTVTVPDDVAAGRYRVTLTCDGGDTATTALRVIVSTRPSRGPATGFGGTAGDHGGALLLGAGLVLVAAGVGLGVIRLRRRVGP
ncbi:MAG TPA: hypothetical protein VGJ53_15630 [Micromonosporaceae bacterium]